MLVLSGIDHDISHSLDRRTIRSRQAGIDFDRIYYADDTVLLTTNTYAANRILWAVERISKQFGLLLSRSKCSYIAMNGNDVIKFDDGTKLKRCTECTYVGHHITQSLNVRQEVGQRMQQTMKNLVKLKPFWKAANCTIRWKLRVYQAIIPNKLIYGLETLHVTQAMLKKIDAFHLRGFRSILGLETTFVNRRNTNEFVLRTASDHSGHEIPLVSDLLLKNRVALAGHILRTNDSDPLRQTAYAPNTACNYPIGQKEGRRSERAMATLSYINIFGTIFRTNERSTETQTDKIERIIKWLSHGTFECSRIAGPRTLNWMPLATKKRGAGWFDTKLDTKWMYLLKGGWLIWDQSMYLFKGGWLIWDKWMYLFKEGWLIWCQIWYQANVLVQGGWLIWYQINVVVEGGAGWFDTKL